VAVRGRRQHLVVDARRGRTVVPLGERLLGGDCHSVLGSERIAADGDPVDADPRELLDDPRRGLDLTPARLGVAMELPADRRESGAHVVGHRSVGGMPSRYIICPVGGVASGYGVTLGNRRRQR